MAVQRVGRSEGRGGVDAGSPADGGSPTTAVNRRARRRRALLSIMTACCLSLGLLSQGVVWAAAGDIGVEGPSTAGTSTPTGNKRAESVVWFNDGIWWADMWNATAKRFYIHRLEPATQIWSNTGTQVEKRANTHADVLWDGAKLYIATHRILNDGLPAEPGFPSHLYRYSYDPQTRSYSLDPGFPTVVNNHKTETLTIDKDSSGRLWGTWQQDGRIYVNRTTDAQGTWGAPFALPQAPDVSVDDTSALIAFGGNRIGVLFSKQGAGGDDGMYWSVHVDGTSDTDWTAPVAAVRGSKSSDDHMNLKWLDSAGGRVYAAIKTEYKNAVDDQIQLLVMDGETGTWRPPYRISAVADCPNRVIVILDEERRLLRTFATYPAPGASCSSAGGAIYEKTTSMDDIAFPPGRGTLRMLDADSPYIHNVSSTKQNITARAGGARGLLVLAHNAQTARYWHHWEPDALVPPPPTASFTMSPSGGAAPLQVAFTDTSSGAPSSWAWDFGDGTSAATQNPSQSYATAGEYTVTLTAKNEGGASTTTQQLAVTPPTSSPPVVRESVSTVVNDTATKKLSILRPAGSSPGDVLISCLALNGGSVLATGVPTGWSPIAAVTGVTNPRVFGYYKVATVAEPSSYDWTLSSTVVSSGGIARYSGARGLGTEVAVAFGTGASATLGALGEVPADSMLVGCVGVNSALPSVGISSPDGMTEVWDLPGKRHEFAEERLLTGRTGTRTWQFSVSREWAGWMAALQPAS